MALAAFVLATAPAAAHHSTAQFSPATECIPYSAPPLMLIPDVKPTEVHDDAIVIRGEFDNSGRTVHMDASSHAEAQPSVQGHSIGRWKAARW